MDAINPEPAAAPCGEELLDRMERAAVRVAERLSRSTSALGSAHVPYALGGSNATSVWIATVDESAVRQARNVELVLRRRDLQHAGSILAGVGFEMSTVKGQVRFLDGPNGTWRDGLEITFGGEPEVGEFPGFEAPDPSASEAIGDCCVLRLRELIEFQLARYRLDDAVDLRDLIDVGLIDRLWLDRLPRELAARLRVLLENPDG